MVGGIEKEDKDWRGDVHRSAESTLKPRLKKKLLEKTSWYKDKKKDDYDEADDLRRLRRE